MDSTAVNQPSKNRMHGALKFFLMTLTGFFSTVILTPCLVGVMTAETKTWTLKDQYALAINYFMIAAIIFLASSGIAGPWLKRWGVAGFLFGMTVALGTALLIAEFMKMFDVPR